MDKKRAVFVLIVVVILSLALLSLVIYLSQDRISGPEPDIGQPPSEPADAWSRAKASLKRMEENNKEPLSQGELKSRAEAAMERMKRENAGS